MRTKKNPHIVCSYFGEPQASDINSDPITAMGWCSLEGRFPETKWYTYYVSGYK